MERRQLECFVAVVDEGGFTRAADALNIAQPTLSQAISSLERSLGARLFDRIGRGVSLTAAGEALVDPARRALRDFAVAEESVSRVRGLVAGHLDVAAIPTLAQPLATLVGKFRTRHPHVVVRSPELDAGSSVETAVASGVCELGLTELPVTASGLVALTMGEQPFKLVAPPKTRVGARVPLARFAVFDFVATPQGTSSRARLDEALRKGKVAEPRVRVEIGNRDALIALVLAGAGAAFLPEPMAEQARKLGARVADTDPVISRRYGLIHRAAPISPAAQAILSLVRAKA
jgi:DNA-binding transcriptional LysR family regulator